jgi:BCD family chlorophyll transporter-like MFS transporter
MVAGTVGSSLSIGALALIGLLELGTALPAAVYVLGIANGAFAVAALGAMMELSAAGGPGREGLRMGVWGASQAVAFALGGLAAGGAVDFTRHVWHRSNSAYAVVFSAAALLFLLAAHYARRLRLGAEPATGLRPVRAARYAGLPAPELTP